jgi:hypothetical protein
MAHYTQTKQNAIENTERLNRGMYAIDLYKYWEFPQARIWKWFVGTDKEYQHELVLLERRKNKKKKI